MYHKLKCIGSWCTLSYSNVHLVVVVIVVADTSFNMQIDIPELDACLIVGIE